MHRRDSFSLRSFLCFTLLIALASCARVVPPPRTVPTPPPVVTPPPAQTPPPSEAPLPPATAAQAGVRPGPALGALEISPAAAASALAAFRISCPDIVRRADLSGLARPADWATACAAASSWGNADALAFFAAHFETVAVGDGTAFATGYYEPEIAGSRDRRPGYDVPVYAKPDDLLDRNPLTGESGRGRLDGEGRYVLYHDRAAIEAGALAGRGLEIAWAADPVDLFFLQIQGSGRLRLPDGGVMRIGYAGQNGREYVAIGRLMRERGILQSPITMQAITAWLRAHPEEGRALMRENRSYVFFRELTGPGPLGALGRPVTPRVSVAADPRFVPLGAPVILAGMDNSLADGLWVAQDTGGAIRGANRFDTFWGAGPQAATIAGGMSARGRAYLLLPRGSLARLSTRNALAPAQR
ncbi:murein transglycosylase A [Sphingosinicella terrae]|uniref:murein transglycosylase A n=1 Tax=Sphingosinicella terrae TaxID=2172047 RepID=UPI00254885A0|nr:murein transglycosylase A [Sphingosinicella terrae]